MRADQLRPVLGQGSGGTIGDLLLSSHCLFDLFCKGRTVSVAIPTSLPAELKEFYNRHTFFHQIIELESLQENDFLGYCNEHGYEPAVHIKAYQIYRDVQFHPLKKWFLYNTQPTIKGKSLVGFQVASSTNFERPKIDFFDDYVALVQNAGKYPVFIGTAKDEETFHKRYPGLKEKFSIPEDHWRFGKDSLLQSFANIRQFQAMITFSSWSAYAAILQGIPAIELWNDLQWQIYNTVVMKMMGSPAHYFQECCWAKPSPYLGSEVIDKMNDTKGFFYGDVFE